MGLFLVAGELHRDMTSIEELYRLWGGKPEAHELPAFIEWASAFNAPDDAYLKYEADYIREDSRNPLEEGQRLSALLYESACGDDEDRTGCATIGSNTKIGHDATATLPNPQDYSLYDGDHNCTRDSIEFEPTLGLKYGHDYIMVADKGVELPPSEPILTTQDLGYHEWKGWFCFGALGVPKDCIINYAEIRLVCYNEMGTPEDPLPCWIKAEKTVNPDPPPRYGYGGWFADRVWTSNWSDFTAQDYAQNEVYYTDNLACVIQELVEQENWTTQSGAFLVIDPQPYDDNGYRLRWVYDSSHDQTKQAKLYVWYSNWFKETGSGGAMLGGSATVTGLTNEYMNGGAKVSGGYTAREFLETMTGGAMVNGSAADLRSWIWVGSSGVMVNGAALVPPVAIGTQGGAVKVNGSALITQTVYLFPNHYRFRVPIIVWAGQVEQDLDGFLLVVEACTPSSDGATYLVTQADGTTPIAHDVWKWDQATERVHLAFHADLRKDTDNQFWLYYAYVEVA